MIYNAYHAGDWKDIFRILQASNRTVAYVIDLTEGADNRKVYCLTRKHGDFIWTVNENEKQ